MPSYKVESCWSGNNNYSFRVTAPDGTRFIIPNGGGGKWTRRHATEAKNQITYFQNVRRENIRFI